jgi:hypothetical protein
LVHLVEHDDAHARERFAGARREHHGERLGREHEHVGRRLRQQRALGGAAVARARGDGDGPRRGVQRGELSSVAGERFGLLLRERPQGREVEHLHAEPDRRRERPVVERVAQGAQ